MDDEKFNLVNEEEVESKSYEELLKLEEDLMHNPEATGLDLAFVTSVILDREKEMGIDNTIKILYKFDSENIYILHIIHHSRDISNLKI